MVIRTGNPVTIPLKVNSVFGLNTISHNTSITPSTNPQFSSIPRPGSPKAPDSYFNNIPLGLK